MLAVTQYDGPAGATPCLIAHGLYGSARNWNVIAKHLSKTRPVLTVDMRNHGASPWADTNSYADLAKDLAEVVEAQGRGALDVIGHSMGGKAAMMLALTRPDCVARLLVGDIAPVAYSHSQVQYIDAMRAVDLSRVTRRSDAAEGLADLGVSPELQAFFTQSLDVAGKRWRYNLDALERDMPKIMSFPEIDAHFTGATLFLSGAQSDYVLPDHRPTIKNLFPNARFAKIPNAGHWLHADNPKAFIATAEVFLKAPAT